MADTIPYRDPTFICSLWNSYCEYFHVFRRFYRGGVAPMMS